MLSSDTAFWRAGAISTTVVMVIMLIILTVDSYGAIRIGGTNVPDYTVINQKIGYKLDTERGYFMPVIGGEELLFNRRHSPAEARALADRGKLVIQTRACFGCHTFFGNGSYYAPDLTKSWLDPAWKQIWQPLTESKTKEEAMVKFLMFSEKYPASTRRMPNQNLTREDAKAVVAYLKWMSAVQTNGFPSHFAAISVSE